MISKLTVRAIRVQSEIFTFNIPVELLITPWVLCNSIILTLWHS